MSSAVELHSENSRRMRDFNRSYSMALYNASVAIPPPPLLLQQNGFEKVYEIPPRPAKKTGAWKDYSDPQIGNGPDRWGYHVVLHPELHDVGDLWNDPAQGGVWCCVESPTPDGNMEKKWLRVM